MTSITPTVRRINFSSPSQSRSPYISGSAKRRTPSSVGKSTPRTKVSISAAHSAEDRLRAAGLDVLAAFQHGDIKNPEVFAKQMRLAVEAQIKDTEGLYSSSLPAVDVQSALLNLASERCLWLLAERSMRMEQSFAVNDVVSRLAKADAFGVNSMPLLTRLRIVSEWLETMAGERIDASGGANLKPLDDPAYTWQYSSPGIPPVVDHYNLTDVEARVEERVSREMWKLLLAGRAEDAEQLSRSIGQGWRAASSFAAGRGVSWISSDGTVGGSRSSWAKIARKIAEDKDSPMSPYEKATLGLLAGVEAPALAACAHYEERLWVRASCVVYAIIKALAEGAEADLDVETLLHIFLQTEGIGERGPEIQSARKVQAYLSLGRDIPEDALCNLLSEMSIAGRSTECSTWLLRMNAHIALVYRLCGLIDQGNELVLELFEETVRAYIVRLIKIARDNGGAGQGKVALEFSRQALFEMIARYASQLSEPLAVELCSEVLEICIHSDLMPAAVERDSRAQCIHKFSSCFEKDMLRRIASAAVDRVWANALPKDVDVSQGSSGIKPKDELAIGILGILILPPVDNPKELLCRTTRLARLFGIVQNNIAAKRLLEVFPNECLQSISSEDCVNERHELECWHAFFHALSRHNEWRNHFFGNRPLPPPESVRQAAVAASGTVAYESQAAANVQMSAYLELLEEYNGVGQRLRIIAVDALNGALTIPGGWMRDIHSTDSPDEENREQELLVVRGIGVPTLVSLLQNILDESHSHSEATQLVDLVASERLKLYEDFPKNELKAFLIRARMSFTNLAQSMADRRKPGEELYKGEIFQDLG
uniref:Nuclear pore complex protein n=1 Tax=Rhodosorus marinus TaxID=101924 RepID=A0A7S2ZQN2_9RHOD|mmetsp:Transcript_28745/g.112110  ORF Transcript_28745/g.112110 Transcript_28745/m.112110 type:complete len:826 (+) Transcript_28745:589-3066(+)|eukprot:CAMPEP_0113956812 /NCGR_PEP_ID=MMETSP0011_2-20120614/2308_1 /TAXON_ID=101924 /ORGANISM="Rhodosorus marinus" /LENGTH=825 /DNA_ID=CAMNT_0000967077 /DNA_START=423 /DNA_END=2900 /DNA_ORIENTATION=+ /assembly_acc=CAM_ASM_000156